MTSFLNSGFKILNQTEAQHQAPKTVIVLGVARSGTTMIASVLEGLGVHLGNKKGKVVLEDLEISELLESGRTKELSQLIQQKNEQFKTLWGFKRPGATAYISKYEHLFRNVHYVVIFRDPLAISMRNELAVDADLIKNLGNTVQLTADLIKFCQKQRAPLLLCSYEKALLRKRKFIKHLAQFLNIPFTASMIQGCVPLIVPDHPIYIEHARNKIIEGYLDKIEKGVISGWAISKVQDQNPVRLSILIDGNEVAQITSNQFRGDLVGMRNGYVAFNFDASSLMSSGEHTISVRCVADQSNLINSPMKYTKA